MIDHSASPIKGITDSFRNADGKLFYRVHWCDTWESAISLQKYQIYIDEYWRIYEEESKNINELSAKESGSFGQRSVFSDTESGFSPKCCFCRKESEKETCDVAVQYEKYIRNIGIQCTALLHDAGVQTLTSHCSRGIQIDLINNLNQPFQKPPTQAEDSKRFTRIKKKCNNVYRGQSTNFDEKKTQPHTNEQKRNVSDQNSRAKINAVHQFNYKTVKTIDHCNCENVKAVDENKYAKIKIVDQNNLGQIKAAAHENHNKMKSYDQNSGKTLETIHRNSHEQIKAIDENFQKSKTIHLNNCEKIETTNKLLTTIEQKETVDKNYRNIQMMDKSSHERLEAIGQSNNEQIYKPMYFIVNDMKEDVGHMNGKKLNEITNKIPSELKRSHTDVLSEPPIILEKNLKLDCDTENNNMKENYSNLSKDKDESSEQEISQNHINNEDDINNQFLSRYW